MTAVTHTQDEMGLNIASASFVGKSIAAKGKLAMPLHMMASKDAYMALVHGRWSRC
jgi:hypothetical protein